METVWRWREDHMETWAAGPLESAPGGSVPEAERSVILADVLGDVRIRV